MKMYTAVDILPARETAESDVIYGFQNATMMGNEASRVDIFADLGVRVIQLTYNPANQLGDGSMAPENRGLTPFGREVVARLNAKSVMVDLSHSGQNTCLDATPPRCSRFPSITRAAARWPICRATRPTRNSGSSPRRAVSSASSSCRS